MESIKDKAGNVYDKIRPVSKYFEDNTFCCSSYYNKTFKISELDIRSYENVVNKMIILLNSGRRLYLTLSDLILKGSLDDKAKLVRLSDGSLFSGVKPLEQLKSIMGYVNGNVEKAAGCSFKDINPILHYGDEYYRQKDRIALVTDVSNPAWFERRAMIPYVPTRLRKSKVDFRYGTDDIKVVGYYIQKEYFPIDSDILEVSVGYKRVKHALKRLINVERFEYILPKKPGGTLKYLTTEGKSCSVEEASDTDLEELIKNIKRRLSDGHTISNGKKLTKWLALANRTQKAKSKAKQEIASIVEAKKTTIKKLIDADTLRYRSY